MSVYNTEIPVSLCSDIDIQCLVCVCTTLYVIDNMLPFTWLLDALFFRPVCVDDQFHCVLFQHTVYAPSTK